jgi:hypothetical protein
MATRKKSKKPKKTTAKKAARKTSAKKSARKARKKASAKSKAPSRKRLSGTRTASRPSRSASGFADTEAGDLQEISRRERADSESVDELLEEGNAFEAGIVQGVEEADDSETREVHTHEVPEDDVPEEYLDED